MCIRACARMIIRDLTSEVLSNVDFLPNTFIFVLQIKSNKNVTSFSTLYKLFIQNLIYFCS